MVERVRRKGTREPYYLKPYGRYGYIHIHDTITEKGKVNRISTWTKDEAEAKRFRQDWLDGLNAPPPKEEMTVADCISKYLENKQREVQDKEMSYKTFTVINNDFKQPLAFFGHFYTRQISKDLCRKYVDFRRALNESLSNSTIRRELAQTRAALNYCHGEKIVDDDYRFYLPRPAKPRQRIFTVDELQRILHREAEDYVLIFCWIAILSGQRKSSILELEFNKNVDFDKNVIDFHNEEKEETSKGRAVIPIPPLLREKLIDAAKNSKSGYVIEFKGNPVKEIKKSLGRHFKNCGVVGASAHTFKHTFVSYHVNYGTSLSHLSGMINTSQKTLEKHYTKVIPDYLKDKFSIMEEIIMNGVKNHAIVASNNERDNGGN